MKSRTHLRRTLAVLLALAMTLPVVAGAAAARDTGGEKNYTIISPYETVDWDTWGQYKANLHSHSTASDGSVNFDKMIEAHYARGYDILAMTDHGVVNRGWNKDPVIFPVLSFQSYLNDPKPLTDERYAEITSGADRGGRGMTDVPFGIELNPTAVLKLTHVNGFFADYGQGLLGRDNDYETPIAGVQALGGLTVINHPGYWLGSGKSIDRVKDPKNVAFFADLLKKYDSCLGVEIAIERDAATQNDRVFWDGLLEKVIPYGRNVWGFANADSHRIDRIGDAWGIFLMPQNTVNNVRTAMENGTFFACTPYARRELGEGFTASGDVPSVTRITVDQEADQITITGTGYSKIEWIAKGEIIAAGNTIDLNDYEDQIGCYVRAQLIGPGGVCFTQAFIADDGSPAPVDPPNPYLEQLWNKIISMLKYTRLYALIEVLSR